MKEIDIVILYMYACTRILRGYDEVGFCVIDLHPETSQKKYEIIVQKSPN